VKVVLVLGVSIGLAAAGSAPAIAWLPTNVPQAMELEHAQLSRQAATEGIVLLENVGASLPIPTSGNVALFGVGVKLTVKGGTGSGQVNNRYNINVLTGFQDAGYTVTTQPAALDRYANSGTNYQNAPGLSLAEFAPTEPTDTALYVIARNSGEGSDRQINSGNGAYYLQANELAELELIGQVYKNVVVVLNTGGIIDTTFFKTINTDPDITDPAGGQALDSLVLLSQAGQEGGRALVDVLSGQASPSGKLTDTWASAYAYYPASPTIANNDGTGNDEPYGEGIYVGYRYFDSFYKSIEPSDPASVVNYPFGYGLSYTDFRIDTQSFRATMDSIDVGVKVTNIGDVYAGKDVVEVYFSAPTRGIDKPYQELVGYAKTDILGPGASQELTISFPTVELASYNEASATYRMDWGQYPIRVGHSSRDTHIVGVVVLDTTVDVEQVSNQLRDQQLADQFVADPADFYSYPGEATELASAPARLLNTSGFVTTDSRSVYEQSVAIGSDSVYYAIDRDLIATTTAYLDPSVTDWEGTGAPYVAKSSEGETTVSVTTDPSKTLFDVAKGEYSMEAFVAGLSVTQLANIVHGANLTARSYLSSARGSAGYTTALYEDLGIPQTSLADGPAGLRLTAAYQNTEYQYATAWPIGTMLAQTFNVELIEQVGQSIGEEMGLYGVTLWLAPGMNIHRDPLCGRNFEYYSEDPLVTGMTAAATSQGVQATKGVGVTIKHYLGNNQETRRSGGNSQINERAAREIYLKGFEIAVKSVQPMAIMSSYNRVNASCVAQDRDSLTDILRGEWGFAGVVMTDWGGCNNSNQVAYMYAGNDLIEPGRSPNTIINATRPTQPTWNSDGLPNRTSTTYIGETRWTWSFGSLVLRPDGASTILRTIDAAPDGSTVDDLYRRIVRFLATPDPLNPTDEDTAFTDYERSAITLAVTGGDPATQVTAYTLTIKGDFKPAMRLGDLQLSATRVLNYVSQTQQFGELAQYQGVSGINIEPYSDQFTNLATYITTHTTPASGGVVTGHLQALRLAVGHYAQFLGDQAAYTPDSFAVFQAAYQVAAGLAAGTAVNPGQATVAMTNLASGFAGLVRGVNTTLLASLIAYADQALADQGAYTTASIAALVPIVQDAKSVLADPDHTQPSVDTAVAQVQGGIAGLVLTGDPTGLAALIEFVDTMVPSAYTPASWNQVATALTHAKTVVASRPAASVLEDAYDALAAAIDALVVRPDVTAISNAVALADIILGAATQYVPGSLVGLAEARNTAADLATNINATATQVATAYDALVAKITTARLQPATPTPAPYTAAVIQEDTPPAPPVEQAAGTDPITVAPLTNPVVKKLTGTTPRIKGQATTGSKLRAIAGKWTTKTTLSYRWYRNGKPIKAATKATYTLKPADTGATITVKITGTKTGYTTLTKTAKPKTITH
jgi:beta-glucosidase